jgi:ABC-type uncharacterized transport system auxiliary subunit
MGKSYIPTLLCALAIAASLTGCAGRGSNQPTAYSTEPPDVSSIPNRRCNTALVVNPAFLGTNEGLGGAGGPDLPGAGGATARGCGPN